MAISFVMVMGQEKSDTMAITTLDEVLVTDDRGFLRDTRMGFHSFSADKIKTLPVIFGEPDLIKAFHTLPGVSAGLEGFSGLYVRGGENDQNLFILDGMPLHNVSHLGGVFSTFNAYSLKKTDFYKSAFPVSFGGKISSVTELQLSAPGIEKTVGSFNLGLISGSMFIATPIKKNKTSIAVALRRTWLDVVTVPTLAIINATTKSEGKKTIGGYHFIDGSLRLDHIWNSRLKSTLTGFYSGDSFKIGEERFGIEDGYETQYHKKDINRLKWQSYGISANMTANIWNGCLICDLYWTGAESKQIESQDSKYSDKLVTNTTSNINSINEWGLVESFDRDISDRTTLKFGMGQSLRRYNPDRRNMTRIDKNESYSLHGISNHISVGELAAYIECDWNPIDKMSVYAGTRIQTYISCNKNHLSVEPRLSMQFSLSKSLSVKVSYSEMSQFMQQVSSNYISLPTDSWLPTGTIGNPLKSNITSIGVYALSKNGYRISAEGWYKDMTGVAEFKEGVSIFNPNVAWSDKITFGKGWAYGCDVSLEKEFGNIHTNISYGLMWNMRKFSDLNGGKTFPAKFDNRHKVDISLNWTIRDNLILNTQWQFMSGNRTTVALYNIDLPNHFFPTAPFERPSDSLQGDYTGADLLTSRNNVRLPAFHRLNIGVTLTGKLHNGMRYSWNFGLYNAYCHMNAFTLTKDYVPKRPLYDPGWHRNFQVFSLIPVIPNISYTLNF